jgi:hypothetical protein
MSDNSISNFNPDNRSDDAKGRLMIIVLIIISAIPLIIGFWASQTGGGFN